MEANELGFILLIVKILIAKISYPFIQAVCAAWMNAYLPFHPLVEIGLRKFLDANNDLYLELNSHCPLKLWKDRLVAVWGQETL